MRINNFSVRVIGGREQDNGYVAMHHMATYTLSLGNHRDVNCDARVTIDGKEVGTFRVYAHQTARLERKPGEDHGKFTFIVEGTGEAVSAGIFKGDQNNGLIVVTFTPEKATPITTQTTFPYPVRAGTSWTQTYTSSSGDNEPAVYGVSSTLDAFPRMQGRAGGTGLTGHSDQEFASAGIIEYDYSGQTTINLRLIEENNPVRPLQGQSNPVPPYISK